MRVSLIVLAAALIGLSAQAQPQGAPVPLRGAAAPTEPAPGQAVFIPNPEQSTTAAAPPSQEAKPPTVPAQTLQSPGLLPGLTTNTQTMPDTGVPFNYARTPENPATPIEDSLRSPLSATQAVNPTGQALQGSARAATVSAVAKLLPKAPLARCRDQNIRFIELTIKNDSSQVALVHGDIAQANVAGVMKTATSARYVGTISEPKLGLAGRVATGVAEVGTLGVAGPIVYENLTPDQHRKRYRGTAIGVDGSRHDIEGSRFGLRVLMPGDESVGWIAFECSGKEPTNVVIPVNYSKSSLPSGTLVVSVVK